MATTFEPTKPATERTPHEPMPPVPKHGHHGLGALFGVLLVLATVMALIAAFTGGDATPDQPQPVAALELTPKAELPVVEATEGVEWTHAPNVPAPLTRSTQAHLKVNWSASEFTKDLDPANGVRYAAWGFEGSSPGPVLRARVGDLIEINLTNPASSTHPHNIDFHFGTGPGGGAPALSASPGQTASVQMRALAPGIYMYHCATPDIPTHIANGMYGYVIIEPEGGLPEVDHEFYVVQSEFYADTSTGRVASLDLAKLDNEEPNYVVLNGAVGSLMGDNALKVAVGDRVRIWFGNAGPQLISSFHVIGEIFDRVYREGDLVSTPAASVQTTLVPAGGGTAVEFTVDVPGTYLLVDHAIARTLHKGALGAIVAEGAENPEIFAAGEENPSASGNDGHGAQATGEQVSITPGAYDQANAATAYSPNEIRIEVGQSLTWTNDDEVAHTVTADEGAFDSGFLDPGASFTFTFDEAGTYTYFCKPHPWMKGAVVVA